METDKPQSEDQPSVETFSIDEGMPPQGGLLKQRHVQMQVSIHRLFLGSGEAIKGAGPLGALIAYVLVSTVAFASLCAIGEMTSFAPIMGTFPYYASRWVDPALGFAVGWNYFYTNAITVSVEVSGAQLLISYWDSHSEHRWIYVLVIYIFTCLINVCGVRWFGEAEFMFSYLKSLVMMIIVLILAGLVIDLGGVPGHDRIGFRYWKDPGPFAGPNLSDPYWGRFLGFLSVIVQAAFSFQGIEIAAIAAVVTESPRRNVAMAIRKFFYRIVIFYIFGILIVGMIVSSNESGLLTPFSSPAQGNATMSPFVIALNATSHSAVPGVVNAGLLTSAFSAGNSFLFTASRTLQALAAKGQAPSIFKETYYGTPLPAILFTSAFSLLSFMSIGNGSMNVFRWFMSLASVGDILTWGTINLTYLYFYRKTFIYWSAFQPWLSIWGLAMCILFALISGVQALWQTNTEAKKQSLVTSYIIIPIFFGLYGFWKITRRTSLVKVKDRDYITVCSLLDCCGRSWLTRFGKGIPSIEETEKPYRKPNGFWEKVADVLF
ncbi:hypothetical protein BDN67DRAFT_984250 [Paxillus ammoniavirescens]|nr:hypothetical protein BDN67DRAFT_984250 [Paxillus ammoniavirescens]